MELKLFILFPKNDNYGQNEPQKNANFKSY